MTNFFDIDSANCLKVQKLNTNNDWVMPEHEHTFWEFIYFSSGTGSVVLPDVTIRPHSYQLVIYPPGLRHAEAADAKDPESTIVLSIDIQLSKNRKLNIPYLLADNGDIGYLAKRIYETSIAKEYKLVNYFVKVFLAVIEEESQRKEPKKGIEFAREYLKSNLQRNFNLTALAAMLDISPSYFSTLFAARYGLSPIKYLRNERLKVAANLLKDTDFAIHKISEVVGYSDQLYFSRIFTSVFGMSPRAYRKSFKDSGF